MVKNAKVCILHLEDNARDAALIQERLKADGLDCDFLTVDSQAQFTAALQTDGVSLILCDYNIPGYDGESALKEAQARRPDVPVIMVSGSLSEEVAVMCLHRGAADYLLKDRMDRLPSAVRRALSVAEARRKLGRAEAELRESEARFRELAENSSEVFWFIGLNPKRMLYVSPAVAGIWGVPAEHFYADPHLWFAAMHPEDRDRVRAAHEACRTGASPGMQEEYRVVHQDGSVHWVADTGTVTRGNAGDVVRLSGVVRDITERKQAQLQLQRAQRLESLGTMAAGVAHDLNNALAPVLLGVEYLRMRYPDATEMIDTMESSVKHGADMVRQLLTFARGAEGVRVPLQPRQVLKEMTKLIRNSFPPGVRLRTRIEAHLPMVMGDSTQLHQVLLNLCVNARDAMPEGGEILLEAAGVLIDAAFASTVPNAHPGTYLKCSVSDSGPGISPEIQDRIFEPFFTTKSPDKGTGLGLSTVMGLVKGHNGFLVVQSSPGQGARFDVYLPALPREPNAESAEVARPAGYRGHGRTVLVVDDEATVRDALTVILKRLGFKVLTAADGTQALLAFVTHRDDVALIISDVSMPDLDGVVLVRAVRRLAPAAKIVMISGFAEARVRQSLNELSIQHFLQKPFTQAELVATLEKALPSV